MSDADELARSTFGFALRPSQHRAVEAVGAGHDTLAVLPTGSGKSAINQVAGLATGGLTVVVSPLIALQRDQALALAERVKPDFSGLRAVLLYSSQHASDRAGALSALRSGGADFVLLGPEQLANAESL